MSALVRGARAPVRPALLLCLLLAAPAAAQMVVTSPQPDRVEVTLYRDPGRSVDRTMDLEWLEGFALISETRQVSIPAGESEVRFEGVAGGIVPQSAIVTGFPDGFVERNRDAFLLSPATLLDRSLGRRVTIRRTSTATGETSQQQAVIRTGSDGAVVLQTAEGFEALRCTGLPETLVYDEVPAGLSSRPTLSVRTRSRQPVSATVTLSYLATGFDWQANYIAELSDDGSRVDLFAWLTLASSDETSFRNADAQAVAGRLYRERVEPEEPEGGPLILRCWPSGRTSDRPVWASPVVVPDQEFRLNRAVDVEQAVNDLPQAGIIVTGSRIARQEELGDLKLYRIPEPVTVAANSQKQVAFLERPNVSVDLIYRQRIDVDYAPEAAEIRRVLVTRNRSEEGLGVPLPAGGVQLFARGAGRPILIGEGRIADRAVGEDIEIVLGEGGALTSRLDEGDFGDDWEEYLLTVVNPLPEPVRYEAEFEVDEDVRFRARGRMDRRDGRPLWVVSVPAGATATLRFRAIDRSD